MFRLSLSRFSALGTLQSRAAAVEGGAATLDATRTLDTAERAAEFAAPAVGTLDAAAYLAADPDYLVPSARRFGLSRFAAPGTLQSRPIAVADPIPVTVAATRDPSVFADRAAEFAGEKGYVAGRSFARPDLSPGVTVSFEEVYSV